MCALCLRATGRARAGGGVHRTKVTMLVGSRRRALVRPRRTTSPGRPPNLCQLCWAGGREGGGGARGCVGECEWRVRVDRWGGDNVRCVVGGECSPAGKAFGRRWGYRMGECWVGGGTTIASEGRARTLADRGIATKQLSRCARATSAGLQSTSAGRQGCLPAGSEASARKQKCQV